MTSFRFRQRLISLGLIGAGLLGSSLIVWPTADASMKLDVFHPAAQSITTAPQPSAPIPAKIESRQIPLKALKMNPFSRRSAATRPADADRLQFLAALRNLRLDSALCTESRRSCSINGTQYAEGDSLPPFTIEKVTPSAATLRNGAYRFELRLQP